MKWIKFADRTLSHKERAERKKHKYIARIKLSNGRYRYFYDQKSYNNFIGSTPNVKLNMHGKSSKIEVSDVEKIKSIWDEGKRYLDYKDTMYKKYKYIAKVQLPNGKTRYFYDPNEYESYMKRNEYQENEPDFMKDIPELNDVFTNLEDMASVNPEFWSSVFGNTKDGDYTTNCMLCTTVYEMRRRGYDVTAAPMTKDLLQRFLDMENNSPNKVYGMAALSSIFKNPTSQSISEPTSLYQELSNQPNTRGNLFFKWNGMNSGHSVAYETNKDGEVTILDSQSKKVYKDKETITDYMKQTYQVTVARTDNLEFSEGVMDGIFETKKK